MSHTHDVFLSHSSLDKEVVRDLAIRLRDRGLRVWFDEWEVRIGDSIPGKIEAGLEGSRVLLFCSSEHAVGSPWAKFELQTFQFRDPLNRERRYVVLRLDDTPLAPTLAPFLYVDWRNGDTGEFEKLVLACRTDDADEFEKIVLAYRTPPPRAEGAGPRIPPAQPISVGASEEIYTAAHHPGGPSTERASVRIGSRYASFDIPPGWAERTGVELSAIQAIEGDMGTVHSQLYRLNDPNIIYALTILSAPIPASMLAPENVPQLVLAVEQHTGMRAVSDVTPVALGGAAGWLWHLQGIVPGTLFRRPHVATMDVHCSEVWVSVDASTAIKMLLTAPRASAHEAAEGLNSVISSWRWRDVEPASRPVERSGSPNLGDMLVLGNMWWHRVGFRKDKLPSYQEACRRCGGTNKLLYTGAPCPDCNGTGRRLRSG
ncbi:MAG TPA: TIR domain-containing protein [Solirubrobacteraceae bacterium]|jgi:hypothetical protein|nr:TIR domain-containing protein [Solirubrobacteraceae bacterium]